VAVPSLTTKSPCDSSVRWLMADIEEAVEKIASEFGGEFDGT
jgi:hypothetical protein